MFLLSLWATFCLSWILLPLPDDFVSPGSHHFLWPWLNTTHCVIYNRSWRWGLFWKPGFWKLGIPRDWCWHYGTWGSWPVPQEAIFSPLPSVNWWNQINCEKQKEKGDLFKVALEKGTKRSAIHRHKVVTEGWCLNRKQELGITKVCITNMAKVWSPVHPGLTS